MEIAYVHFYTRDARRTSNWFIRNLGFQAIAKSTNDLTHTEVIGNNTVLLLVSSPLNFRSSVYRYLEAHPPGVADLAFKVTNLERIFAKAIDFGAKILQFPQRQATRKGTVKLAKIVGWDSLEHTLIEDAGDRSTEFLWTDREWQVQTASTPNRDSGITGIDHIVLNVAAGELEPAAAWYRHLFSLQVRQSFKIQTARSGLYSQALVDRSGKVQFNLNEPTSTNSQIQEFLDFNHGSGIQHLALRCNNLIDSVNYMRSREVTFYLYHRLIIGKFDKSLASELLFQTENGKLSKRQKF